MKYWLFAAPALLLGGTPSQAAEVFGGAYVHDVHTPFTKSGQERGVDFQLGVRGGRISALGFIGSPSPNAFVAVNSAGDTNYGAVGLSWKLGGKVYVRPGVGLAVHDGPSRGKAAVNRIDFGSRVLFEPELGVGIQAGSRTSVELSWMHLSHAQIFSKQNPGMDSFGFRLNRRF